MTAPARATSPRRLVWVAVLALLASACRPVVELRLPDVEAVLREVPVQSVVYDSEGNRLAVLRREFRETVSLDDLPQHLLDAVITAEDQRFLSHGGVDARAIARAALTNVASGEVEQGGSTITQQLVENLFMPATADTFETKLEETLLARQLETEWSKQRILEEYLNIIYLGSGAYGVEAAAYTYWRQSASELTLAESALLAAVIRSPASLNPHDSPGEARERRDHILERMATLGYVTAEAAEQAAVQPIEVEPRPPAPQAEEPHWVDFVTRVLLSDPTFGDTEAERAQRLYGGGLHIHTTLDPDMQATARATMADVLPDPDEDDPDAAVVTVDPRTGHILAAAGSVAYDELQYRLATQARRAPGSTFKTFVAAAAVVQGLGPHTDINGDQGEIDTGRGWEWDVDNYDRRDYGDISLAGALRASVNVAFARLIVDVGSGRVASLATAMGVTSPVPDNPVIAIGSSPLEVTPLDMAAAYATLANGGERVPVTAIERIEDSTGEVVRVPDVDPVPVLPPSAAYVVTRMLQDVVAAGTGLAARIDGWEVAGKTGTTDDYTNAWFVGYTPTLSTAVWVGHEEGLIPMRNVNGVSTVTGGSIPATLWQHYMSEVLDGQVPVDFSLPADDHQVLEIDPETGLRAAPWCPGEPTPVPDVLVPRETCPSPEPTPPPAPPEPAVHDQPEPAQTTATPTPTPTSTATSTATPTPTEPTPSQSRSPPRPWTAPEPTIEAASAVTSASPTSSS